MRTLIIALTVLGLFACENQKSESTTRVVERTVVEEKAPAPVKKKADPQVKVEAGEGGGSVKIDGKDTDVKIDVKKDGFGFELGK